MFLCARRKLWGSFRQDSKRFIRYFVIPSLSKEKQNIDNLYCSCKERNSCPAHKIIPQRMFLCARRKLWGSFRQDSKRFIRYFVIPSLSKEKQNIDNLYCSCKEREFHPPYLGEHYLPSH
jgi:hypothetical protein